MRPLYIFLLVVFAMPLPLLAQSADKALDVNFDRIHLNLTGDPYEIKEIISLTDDQAPIGIGYRGLDYVPHLVGLRGGRTESFADLLAGSAQRAGGTPAIVRVTGLAANQQVGFSAVRIKVELEMELLLEQTDGNYLAYGPVRGVQMEGGGAIKRAAPREIAELFQETLRKLYELVGTETESRAILAANLHNPPKVYPIQSTDVSTLPDGVFHSYMDFRAGKLDTTHAITVRNQDLMHEDEYGIQYYLMNYNRPATLSTREFRAIWGIHFEGTTSVNLLDGQFYDVHPTSEGDYYTIMQPSLLTTRFEGSGTSAALGGLFGVAGAIAGAAIANGKRNNELTWFDYDLSTGRFVPEGGTRVTREIIQRIVVISSNFSKAGNDLTITGDEGEFLPLEPNGHVELADATKVCFTIDGGEVICETVPESIQYALLKVARLLVKGNDKYRIEWLAGTQAEREVEKLR